ncbi:hypothetical protein [Peribacillus tepidiphilus]|uniref:hypothetical protein n=1 Tax=Peribacillus tepidiphilus TaxID=2652445 RepID=UPI0035B4FC45
MIHAKICMKGGILSTPESITASTTKLAIPKYAGLMGKRSLFLTLSSLLSPSEYNANR